MNLRYLEESPDILAVMLFGSAAREDSDTCSDWDIFILCVDLSLNELLRVKQYVIRSLIGDRGSVCAYRRRDVVIMASKGSLFLWHLRLEGKIIFSKDGVLEEILAGLKRYCSYADDLNCYKGLLGDVKLSVKKWYVLSEFDLSLLFTISRNVCMLLCHHEHKPTFGRFDVYSVASDMFREKFPLSERLYRELCSWKMWYERGVKLNSSLPNEIECSIMVREVEGLLEFAEEKCL